MATWKFLKREWNCTVALDYTIIFTLFRLRQRGIGKPRVFHLLGRKCCISLGTKLWRQNLAEFLRSLLFIHFVWPDLQQCFTLICIFLVCDGKDYGGISWKIYRVNRTFAHELWDELHFNRWLLNYSPITMYKILIKNS